MIIYDKLQQIQRQGTLLYFCQQKYIIPTQLMSTFRPPNSVYKITNSSRFPPHFIGIAQIYNQHKTKRKSIQNLFNQTCHNLHYLEKLNSSLSKTLESKQKQLQTLQKVRQRHENDVLEKIQQQQLRNTQLQQLKRKTHFQKQKLKSSIKRTIHQMKSEKKQSTNQIKWNSTQLDTRRQQKNRQLFQKRKSMHETIREQKNQGQRKVNAFYLKRNLQSLVAYNNKIQMEDKKSLDFESGIQRMKKSISEISKSNHKKEKKLEILDFNISKLNPLKTFFSIGFNETQRIGLNSRCSQKSTSSKRPSEILLDDHIIFPSEVPFTTLVGGKQRTQDIQNPEKQL